MISEGFQVRPHQFEGLITFCLTLNKEIVDHVIIVKEIFE